MAKGPAVATPAIRMDKLWIPVYIPLRRFVDKPTECVVERLREAGFQDDDINWLKDGLSHDQAVLFILDGMDELVRYIVLI